MSSIFPRKDSPSTAEATPCGFVLVNANTLRDLEKKVSAQESDSDKKLSAVNSEAPKPLVETKLSALQQAPSLMLSRRGRSQQGPDLPPTLDSTQHFRFRAYYTSSSGTFTSISPGHLCCAAGAICFTANANMRSIASAIKLRSITVWPNVSDGAGATYPIVNWSSSATNFVKDQELVRPLPLNATVTSSMVFKPPKDSNAHFWITASVSSPIVNMSVTAGSVILLDMDVCIANSIAGFNETIVTGTTGTMYYGYMDGSTTHRYQPIALTSTF